MSITTPFPGGWSTFKMMKRVRVPHPFPVLGKGAGFDFAFFFLV